MIEKLNNKKFDDNYINPSIINEAKHNLINHLKLHCIIININKKKKKEKLIKHENPLIFEKFSVHQVLLQTGSRVQQTPE